MININFWDQRFAIPRGVGKKGNIKLLIIILGIVLLSTWQMKGVKAINDSESMFFSDSLVEGDVIDWEIVDSSSVEQLNIIFGTFVEGETIKMEILKTPVFDVFQLSSNSSLSEYFKLSLGGNVIDLDENDDVLFWFLSPTVLNLSNGTVINPAEVSWVYFVNDDLTYLENSLSITHAGNITRYASTIIYNDDESNNSDETLERIDFLGSIDISNGVVQSFAINVVDSLQPVSFEFKVVGKFSSINYNQNSPSSVFVTLLAVGSVFSLVAGSYLIYGRYFRAAGKGLLMSDNMRKIISPIFQSQPDLIYLFAGTTLIKDKNLDKEILSDFPNEIFEFKDFLHPVRLSLIKLLYDNTNLTTMELKDTLQIDRIEIYNHINALKKKGYLRSEQQFINGSMKTVVQLEPKTIEQFQRMTKVLVDFLVSSPNIDRFMEQAIIARQQFINDNLYPDKN